MNQQRGVVFISCGQRTDEEKKLGQQIVQLVESLTPYDAYFAEYQQSLDGLTKNIFESLNRMVGFITVMHKRGEVSFSGQVQFSRGSVWIEQEIAIASFLVNCHGKKIGILSFIEDNIEREGVRDFIILNPVFFKDKKDILDYLKIVLPEWQLEETKEYRELQNQLETYAEKTIEIGSKDWNEKNERELTTLAEKIKQALLNPVFDNKDFFSQFTTKGFGGASGTPSNYVEYKGTTHKTECVN